MNTVVALFLCFGTSATMPPTPCRFIQYYDDLAACQQKADLWNAIHHVAPDGYLEDVCMTRPTWTPAR